MNLVIGGGLTLASWAFPQLAAPLTAYRYGKVAYKISNFALNCFRGNVFGSVGSIWSLVSSARDCDVELQMCLDNIIGGWLGDGGTGISDLVCWGLYRQCIASN